MTADRKDDYVCLLVAGDQHEVQNIHPVIEPRIGSGIVLKTSYIHFRSSVKIQYEDDTQFKGSNSQEHYTMLTELWYNGIEEDFKEAKDAVAKFEWTTATSTSQAPQIVAHNTSILPGPNGIPAAGVSMINVARGASVATRLGVTNRSYSHAADSNSTAQRAGNLALQAYNRAGSNLSRR